MAKTQLNARVSDLTKQQLEDLGSRWGTTQTETLTVIIDRMYRQEIKPMTETINVTFNPSDLPAWAQKDADVVERCKSNLAFRCDVYDAQTAQRQRQLIAKTHRLMDQLRNR